MSAWPGPGTLQSAGNQGRPHRCRARQSLEVAGSATAYLGTQEAQPAAASSQPRWSHRRLPLLAATLLVTAGPLRPTAVTAQTEFFTALKYRGPAQCERAQCLSQAAANCKEELDGFYNKEKGCQAGQICTNCAYGNISVVTLCYCENPPYSVPALYNQLCNSGVDCAQGEGECFRPCGTYLHVTLCPTYRCEWNTETLQCEDLSSAANLATWANVALDATPYVQGQRVVAGTTLFPIDFDNFKASSAGYRIRGILIEDVIKLQSLFSELDSNFDGLLSSSEYAGLPNVLAALDAVVVAQIQASNDAQAATETATARRLQLLKTEIPSPEVCNSRRPRQFYCSFDVSCKSDCRECGWKSATDRAFATCVQPSADACFADGGKVFCSSDLLCHPPGDCSNCVDRPVVDHMQHSCLAVWWNPQPLTQWTNWVCRFRNKVGMGCRNDQDCIYGMKRCLQGQCQPFQPYNPNQTCASDYDCPHLNYYCPPDPTGGQNQYWVQYCRQQRDEGMTCSEDRECKPHLLCNSGEGQPRCRRLFSLDLGNPADRDILCRLGWRDRNGLCAPAAKSKQAGRSCDSDLDCTTTDQTGRTGLCTCKAWWDQGDSKYCAPVAGDYARHQESLRNYLWFRATKCGSFWTEEECLNIFGAEAQKLKYALDCETQQLSGGPYLPPAGCGIVDETRFVDACAKLAALG